jgi:DNA-directed RNA polymerase subunit omega
MARVTIEDCLEKVDSRFALVHLAVQRVLQLRNGAPLTLEAKNKEIVMALREIAAGKVSVENIRQFEEIKSLPGTTTRQDEEVTRQEVKEILEEATQFDVTSEYKDLEQLAESNDEQGGNP